MATKTITVNGVKYQAVSKTKKATNKGTTLERFNAWCDKKGYKVEAKKSMTYKRQDGTEHKGLLVTMKDEAPSYYVFEAKWGQVANCTLEVKV